MTTADWIAQGRPHWQCRCCKRVFVTIPVRDDFVCPACTPVPSGDLFGAVAKLRAEAGG